MRAQLAVHIRLIALLLLLSCLAVLTTSCGLSAQNPSLLTSSESRDIAISGQLGVAEVGAPYGAEVSASGGAKPYQFAISSGTLPPGLTMNATTGLVS